jgi:deazaflavin-dependent oxidoreductase (nitroreductase family)
VALPLGVWLASEARGDPPSDPRCAALERIRVVVRVSLGRPHLPRVCIRSTRARTWLYQSINGTSLSVHMDSKVPPIPRHADVEADPGVLARFNSAVIEEFRANAGVVGGPFKDSAVMLLTTTGAKSGQQRMTPLEYFRVDDRVIFVGTRGGASTNPAWVHNLRANPSVHAEIGAESYEAVARELSGDERESVYSKVKELCPRILTYPVPARQIPVFELKRT